MPRPRYIPGHYEYLLMGGGCADEQRHIGKDADVEIAELRKGNQAAIRAALGIRDLLKGEDTFLSKEIREHLATIQCACGLALEKADE